MELHGFESQVRVFPDQGGNLLGVLVLVADPVRVRGHAVPIAAQQPPHRLAARPPVQIPDRHVQGADRAHRSPARAPKAPREIVHPLPEPGRPARVFAHEHGREFPLDQVGASSPPNAHEPVIGADKLKGPGPLDSPIGRPPETGQRNGFDGFDTHGVASKERDYETTRIRNGKTTKLRRNQKGETTNHANHTKKNRNYERTKLRNCETTKERNYERAKLRRSGTTRLRINERPNTKRLKTKNRKLNYEKPE